MAKVGEGDPRWLVENRPDGRNVGNWHWEEKNLIPWSKQTLTKLFTDLSIDSEEGLCQITNFVSVSGDAALHLRKGQFILIYDLEIILAWRGQFVSTNKSAVEGQIKIYDLSQDNADHDFKYEVTSKSKSYEESKFKFILETKGKDLVTQKISEFLQAMRAVDCGVPPQAMIEKSNSLRQAGNEHFKNSRFREALVQYDKAFQMLSRIRSNAAIDVEVNTAKISCLLNKAACNMKLSQFRDVISECSSALEIDGKSVKALYRRSQAYCSVKEFKEALDDIRLAAKIEPSNKEVDAQLSRVNKMWQDYKKKQSKKLGGMFGGNWNDD
eukprot:TRINITY_DN10745_c0_g1_i2.p1 TRINITY_DN10745_c0_g1~~TRINITY_DN10745_c0_g1_i2.p1  ORF type:complete len:342 (-),score=63.99 TRINITY_DN10745_c0_g1_i2:34-1011(-)